MTRNKKPWLKIVDGEGPSRAVQYAAAAAETERCRFIESCSLIASRCESPIEELLAMALYNYSRFSMESVYFYGTNAFPTEVAFDRSAHIYQQVEIGPYRVDFLIHDATLPITESRPRYMVVECDGHDFHERTKHQARRDKQRDRFFQSKGFKVLRFTGSEIWEDPDKCSEEIFEQFACNDHWRNRPAD